MPRASRELAYLGGFGWEIGGWSVCNLDTSPGHIDPTAPLGAEFPKKLFLKGPMDAMPVAVHVEVQSGAVVCRDAGLRAVDEGVILGPGSGGIGIAARGLPDRAIGVELGAPKMHDHDMGALSGACRDRVRGGQRGLDGAAVPHGHGVRAGAVRNHLGLDVPSVRSGQHHRKGAGPVC